MLDDDDYQAVRGASNLSSCPPIFLLSALSNSHYPSFLFRAITQLARNKVLPASTKITLLSLSPAGTCTSRKNHNNQRTIRQLRHFGVNLITAWHVAQPSGAGQHFLASWNPWSWCSICGNSRGLNWLPPWHRHLPPCCNPYPTLYLLPGKYVLPVSYTHLRAHET